ncbi:MAG: hypothetical protein JSW46_00310 [Gemmatimonadota bacterium]|nr:MAG: hypothetical protein JSW46_00310 [Gemmatimonadota bacterium]
MIAPRILFLVVALVLTPQAGLFAQQESVAPGDRAGVALRLVPGVLYAGASFGDESAESSGKFGFSIGGQFSAPMSRSLGFFLEGVWQPTKVENPHDVIDEAFSAFYLLGGLQFGGEDAYLRPSVGVVWRSWSGADALEETETGLALGLAIGYEKPLGRLFHMSPELELRVSGAHGLSTYVLALQVPVGWRPAGHQ